MSFFQNQIVKMLTDMLGHVDTPAFILDGQSGRLHGWNELFVGLFPQSPEPGCLLADLLPCREVIDWLADYYQQKFTPDENWRPGVWSFVMEGLEDEPVNVRLEIIHFGEKTGLLVVSFSIIRDWLAGAEPDHLGTLIHDFTGAAAFMDLEGRFQIANQPMSEFLKLPMDEIINRSFMDIFPDDVSWPLETIFHRAISSGVDQLEEMETMATGESVWLQVMFNVVRKNGQLIGAYFSAQDTRRIGAEDIEETDSEDDFFSMDFEGSPPAEDGFFESGGSQTPQFLNLDSGNFEAGARRVLAFLGESAAADRVDIWQIHGSSFSDDEAQYVSQLYEWSQGAGSAKAPDAPVLAGRLLSEVIPNWREAFEAGECINELAEHMPPEEKAALEGLGVVSILVAPIAIRGTLWGFIGLQDCHAKRRFSAADEQNIRLVVSLLDLLIQNRDMAGALEAARQDKETLGIQLEQAQSGENDRARLAERFKQARCEFLTRLGDEILDPTHVLLDMTELLAHSELTEGQRNFVEKTVAASQRLWRIAADIADFAKTEDGSLKIERAPFDLSAVLVELSNTFAEKVEEKKLDFQIKVARTLPTHYVGDRAHLTQALMALVDNAVNCTDEGSVLLTVDPAPDDEHLAFKISDTGQGFSQESLDSLFTPFARIDCAKTGGGSGLALPLCRELVLLMGGEISCESKMGQGSAFYFTIYAPSAGTAGTA